MRITDLHVDGFGVWNNLELRRLSPEVTVFYGLNEAGKTTLMQFLRSVLYGVSPDRREAYLPPVYGGRPGGRLGMVTDDGPFVVSRYADRGDDDYGRVTVEIPDGTQQGDRLLREAIEHVDEATFNNVFAVGLDEIQLLGTLGGSEAAQWIYRLTSGLDRISLYDVIQGLRSSRGRILGEANAKSEIARLLEKKEHLEAEIALLAGQTRAWCQRGVEIAEIESRITALRDDLRARERHARRVEVARNIRPQWAKRLEVERGIELRKDLHQLDKNAIADLDELNERLEEHRRQREIHKGQRHQLRDEAEKLGINEVLVNNCCRVEGLAEQQEWLENLAREAEADEAEAKQLASKAEAETRRLAQQWFNDPNRRLILSPEQIEKLNPQRSALETAQKQFAAAEIEFKGQQSEEERYLSQLESATATSEQLGLPADVQSAGELVARLRRRLQVEQSIEQTRRLAIDLEQQARDTLDGQIMPLRVYGLAVISTVGGAAFLTAWMLSGQGDYGLVGGILAAVGLGIPFMRWTNEARYAEEYDNVQHELERLAQQLEKSKEERDRLDSETPVAEGSIVLRLQTAERHLAELEEMLPVESERRKATEASRSAKQRYDAARERLAVAERDWRSQLKALGLPQELGHKELQLLAGQYEQLGQLESKAKLRLEDMERRQREFQRVVSRIERLAQESGLVLDKGTPLEQLQHLLEESRMQKAHIAHREKLRERAKELKIVEARHAKAAIGLDQKRANLFQKAGVDGETAYRQLAAELAERDRLVQQRESLTREIAAAIGTLGSEDDFQALLAPDVVGTLDSQWTSITAEHAKVETDLDGLVKQRAGLLEQQKRLADDTALAEKQMELGLVGAELSRAEEAWRERATVSLMLERVRNDYEKNRQPETLVEATEYFSQLTGGQYTRIWTPLANDVLLVDKADGQSLSVDRLSRGTREQLFLSVRMALVATFARRGIQLPMILDDVLVNYDEKRAARAAKVLCDFAAQGHQVLVFSCHEHILAIFRKLSADCRRLPSRFEVEDAVEDEEVLQVVEEPAVEEVVAAEPEAEAIDEPEEEVAEEFEEEELVPVDYHYRRGIPPRPKAAPLVEYEYVTTPAVIEEVSVAEMPEEVHYDWQQDELPASPWHAQWVYPNGRDDRGRIGHAG